MFTYFSSLLSISLFVGILFQSPAADAAMSGEKVTSAQREFAQAVQRGNLEKISTLITEGVDVNQSIGDFTPLMLARDTETVRVLVQAGADVNAISGLFKQTVLMFTVGKGKPEIVKALVDAGANVNVKIAASEMTALSTAVMSKRSRLEVIEILLAAGADPNNGLILDMPILTAAVMGGRIDVMEALIGAGADINARNGRGETPLMVAVASGRTEAAELLIAAGADANADTMAQGGSTR